MLSSVVSIIKIKFDRNQQIFVVVVDDDVVVVVVVIAADAIAAVLGAISKTQIIQVLCFYVASGCSHWFSYRQTKHATQHRPIRYSCRSQNNENTLDFNQT